MHETDLEDAAMAAGCPLCANAAALKPAMDKDGYTIVRCANCGVGRTVVHSFDPEAHYVEGYFTGAQGQAYLDYEGSEKTLRREFSRTVDFLLSFIPKGGKLLEIGCAYGFFLQEAKRAFDVHGVEVAQTAVAFCHRTGLPNVTQGVLTEDMLQRIGPLDAIVMLDVIEHIDDVAGTMEMASRHLKPGGVILLTTGDWNSLAAKLTGRRWRLLTPPLHLWYFTPKSLQTLFQRLGCTKVHLSHPWKLVPLELILSQATTMLGLKWNVQVPRWAANVGVPATMFDAMRMVFRKTDATGPKI
jgi:SAM-dependent methyltransferase